MPREVRDLKLSRVDDVDQGWVNDWIEGVRSLTAMYGGDNLRNKPTVVYRAESQPMPPVKNVTNSTSQSDKEEWVDSISFYDKHVVDNKEEYFIDAINDQCLDVADKALFMPGIDKAIYRQLNLDSVARPAMLNMTQFNGYFGCTFYYHPGAMLNGSMKYPMSEEIYPDRTDAEVRNDMKISLPLPSTVLEGFLPVSVDRRRLFLSQPTEVPPPGRTSVTPILALQQFLRLPGLQVATPNLHNNPLYQVRLPCILFQDFLVKVNSS
ncbi:unnamed protein product [Timema podura]|uniref:Uncharacterized protein n=1 Tax=Timema podura TaxID=61482 RepID=A0ABN7P6E7_TIMPD|nr:unnamed protein product [Timema podura]